MFDFQNFLSSQDLPYPLKHFFQNALKSLEREYLQIGLSKICSYPFPFLLKFSSSGLHGQDEHPIYRTTSTEQLILVDVKSMYPNIIDIYDLYPPSITSNEKERFQILLRRKMQKNDATVKPFINHFYGSILQPSSSYYDLKTGRTICYMGQILILILLMRLSACKGVRFINVNTDGVIFLYPKEKESMIRNTLFHYTSDYHLEFKQTKIDKMFQKNINDYVLFLGNEEKIVGSSLFFGISQKSNFTVNKDEIIVKKAVLNKLKNNISMEKIIREEENPANFLFFRNVGESYSQVTQQIKNANKTTVLYHPQTLRFIASKNVSYGRFYKSNDGFLQRVEDQPKHPIYVSKIDDRLFSLIDYDYYIYRANQKYHEFTGGFPIWS